LTGLLLSGPYALFLTKQPLLLSVIIINYNVKYFLEQCLFSVMRAMEQVEGEVIVVDNASQDGSKEHLRGKFPTVRFVWNKENVGFARANNEALAAAKGEYVLFLNPDTIVAEDSFATCIHFLEKHKDAGAVGVHMIDGRGKFLKESKRAYPTLAASFYKLSGLSALFPSSPTFSKYHLGHLDPSRDHEVDVLSGAFLMARKVVLERTGGFDEAFFMYGEDIDLSYRIQKLGYRNYYCAKTTIIHFKGESTKKGSLNYVRMFYLAMIIFVQKHYSGITAKLFRIILKIAIWARAAISILAGVVRKNGLPMIDAVNTLFAVISATWIWNRFVKPETVYQRELLFFAFPAFTLIFLVVAYYAGLYDRQQKKGRLISSTIFSVVVVLALYSLLPEKFRFSRGILLLGSLFSFILIGMNRLLLRRWGWIEEEEEEKLGTVVVGATSEFEEVSGLMQVAEKEERVLGRIALQNDGQGYLTTLDRLDGYLREVPLREIIFCQGQLSFKDIIERSAGLQHDLRVRIHARGSGAIIGSDSRRSAGKTLSAEQSYAIATPQEKRFKRLVDVMIALLMFAFFPIHFFFLKEPLGLFSNAWHVLTGRKTWVGYSGNSMPGMPVLMEGIIGTNALPVNRAHQQEESLIILDQLYARDYTIYRDIHIISKGYKWLGT
jgi:GT2 family glycosyltransferase